MLALAVTALSSFSAQADDWPANADALMAKQEIDFKIDIPLTRMYTLQVILNLKEKSYRSYSSLTSLSRCKSSTISEPVKISETQIEIRTPKEGLCDAKIITVDLSTKSISFLAYEGDRANAKETYTSTKAEFK